MKNKELKKGLQLLQNTDFVDMVEIIGTKLNNLKDSNNLFHCLTELLYKTCDSDFKKHIEHREGNEEGEEYECDITPADVLDECHYDIRKNSRELKEIITVLKDSNLIDTNGAKNLYSILSSEFETKIGLLDQIQNRKTIGGSGSLSAGSLGKILLPSMLILMYFANPAEAIHPIFQAFVALKILESIGPGSQRRRELKWQRRDDRLRAREDRLREIEDAARSARYTEQLRQKQKANASQLV